MTQPFSRTVNYCLDKKHFQECFAQSVPPVQSKDYRKAFILGFFSVALMFVKAEHYYIPFFLLCLAIIEVFSIQYRQAWWVWRQLMSKSAYAEVRLTIDEKGLTTESEQVNSELLWGNVKAIEQTEKGLLLKHQQGVNYLSNSHLDDELIEFVLKHKSAS